MNIRTVENEGETLRGQDESLGNQRGMLFLVLDEETHWSWNWERVFILSCIVRPLVFFALHQTFAFLFLLLSFPVSSLQNSKIG